MRFKINWIILPDRFLKIFVDRYIFWNERQGEEIQAKFFKVYILLFELVLPVLESDKWEG